MGYHRFHARPSPFPSWSLTVPRIAFGWVPKQMVMLYFSSDFKFVIVARRARVGKQTYWVATMLVNTLKPHLPHFICASRR